MEALSRSAFARWSSRWQAWSSNLEPNQVLLASTYRRSIKQMQPLEAGTLLRGQPYISELAWERGHRHGHQAYSLVGMIHTLAPPKVRELIGEVLLAPVQPWDA